MSVNKKLIMDGCRQSAMTEDYFAELQYYRTVFKNITVPAAMLTDENRSHYYWILYNLDEIARKTGETIEFSVIESKSNKILIDVLTIDGSTANECIEELVGMVLSENWQALQNGDAIPNYSIARPDPLTHEEMRIDSAAAELIGDPDEVVIDIFDDEDQFDLDDNNDEEGIVFEIPDEVLKISRAASLL